jgi:hypothetical protein
MSIKQVRFHPEAEAEYLATLSWYLDRSPVAGADFEKTVTKALESIEASPTQWPVYLDEFRKYTLRHFPFSVIYRELLSEVVILL